MVPNLHFQVKHRWHKAGSVLQYLDKPKGVFGWPEFDHFVGKSCSFHAKTTIAEKKHGTSKSPVLKRNIHLPNGVPCQFSKVDGFLNYQKKYSPKGVLLETRHSDSPQTRERFTNNYLLEVKGNSFFFQPRGRTGRWVLRSHISGHAIFWMEGVYLISWNINLSPKLFHPFETGNKHLQVCQEMVARISRSQGWMSVILSSRWLGLF